MVEVGDRPVVIALAVVGIAAAALGVSIVPIERERAITCGDRFVG
jgi:hypothetical protein